MKGKYKIQPIPGHPAPEWRAQFDGVAHGMISESGPYFDLLQFRELVKEYNKNMAFNPFSMMRKG